MGTVKQVLSLGDDAAADKVIAAVKSGESTSSSGAERRGAAGFNVADEMEAGVGGGSGGGSNGSDHIRNGAGDPISEGCLDAPGDDEDDARPAKQDAASQPARQLFLNYFFKERTAVYEHHNNADTQEGNDPPVDGF